MDSDLVRKCPASVITLRFNAEICNGHGTFPDKFSISDPPFSTGLSDPPFPTHSGAGGAERSDARVTRVQCAARHQVEHLRVTAASTRRRRRLWKDCARSWQVRRYAFRR